MTVTEIENKIAELETEMFYLRMADHWAPEDYAFSYKLNCEILQLKKMLTE